MEMSEFVNTNLSDFKGVWVFCEQREGKLMPTDYELISEGRKLADELGVTLTGVLCGDGVEGIAGELGGFGTRFLGLNVPWGQFGIHGTNKPGSIGTNASHGCIRMYVKDSEELYGMIGNGAKVVIEGGPYGWLDQGLKILHPGDRSSHVAAVQARLLQLGYGYEWPDGIYGAATQAAVKRARKALGLPERDFVDEAFYRAIGLILFE